MALGAKLGAWIASEGGAGAALADFSGMVMVSLHVGHGISEPAPASSTDNSWPQLGQLKMISISALG
jgi:hypothetical protein